MVALFGRALDALAHGTDFDQSHLVELPTALSLLGTGLGRDSHGLSGQKSGSGFAAGGHRVVVEMTDADFLFRGQIVFRGQVEHYSSSIKTPSLRTPFQEN